MVMSTAHRWSDRGPPMCTRVCVRACMHACIRACVAHAHTCMRAFAHQSMSWCSHRDRHSTSQHGASPSAEPHIDALLTSQNRQHSAAADATHESGHILLCKQPIPHERPCSHICARARTHGRTDARTCGSTHARSYAWMNAHGRAWQRRKLRRCGWRHERTMP